eukprot:CAMPEP_0181215622 /NCGR_PEP_ID=MMETSP1096-20121128/26115_1 /TAXON_ID=156174 ORGANISM="Chrysochromulina ericina, Strain CCMP281" /NCGR_SAMPLE_ID=MMETSP1096 /ASSEMBLY_ACC=CAM_ASM_000453 /LENGTH=176 /DNA_ID=CAMNT_0023307497 /DNA_START=147 /DNA_END=674 /DNA_ORIENTATION=-
MSDTQDTNETRTRRNCGLRRAKVWGGGGPGIGRRRSAACDRRWRLRHLGIDFISAHPASAKSAAPLTNSTLENAPSMLLLHLVREIRSPLDERHARERALNPLRLEAHQISHVPPRVRSAAWARQEDLVARSHPLWNFELDDVAFAHLHHERLAGCCLRGDCNLDRVFVTRLVWIY